MSNIPLKTITFPGLDDTYTIPQVDNTLLTAGAAADAKKTGDEITDLKEALTTVSTTLTHKADKSGVVASAEQLLSDVGTEDKAPYLFRATPYDSTRVDEEVVGVSVGWNQYARYNSGDIPTARDGMTFSSDDQKSCTVGGTLERNSYVTGWFNLHHSANGGAFAPANVNHVFLLTSKHISGTAEGTVQLSFASAFHALGGNTAEMGASKLLKPSESSNDTRVSIYFTSGTVLTNYKFTFQCIDLTAWFGSAIADYAYTLEQATAGSGVAWIKALLPGGYIPYSAPGLKSVSGLSGHKFVGFNAWDGVYEAGYYDVTTGAKASGGSWSRCANYIPCLPNTSYYAYFEDLASTVGFLLFYDADKNYISNIGASSFKSKEFTTPANAYYMTFYANNAIFNSDVCINLSDPARNGQYEPYKATTYALDSDLTLRGILKMDSDHNVYADGDVYGEDGTVNRRYGVITLDGSQNFADSAPSENPNGGYNAWFTYAGAGMSDVKKGSADIEKRSDKFIYAQRTSVSGQQNNIPIGSFSGNVTGTVSNDNWLVFAFDSSFDTYAKIKAWFTANPTIVLYEKDTPTTETADPYASPQNCAPGGTEEYVYGESGSGIPVGHNSKYQKNMRSELERVSVAVPEVGSTAGTYVLKATVTAQGVTYAWVSD